MVGCRGVGDYHFDVIDAVWSATARIADLADARANSQQLQNRLHELHAAAGTAQGRFEALQIQLRLWSVRRSQLEQFQAESLRHGPTVDRATWLRAVRDYEQQCAKYDEVAFQLLAAEAAWLRRDIEQAQVHITAASADRGDLSSHLPMDEHLGNLQLRLRWWSLVTTYAMRRALGQDAAELRDVPPQHQDIYRWWWDAADGSWIGLEQSCVDWLSAGPHPASWQVWWLHSPRVSSGATTLLRSKVLSGHGASKLTIH